MPSCACGNCDLIKVKTGSVEIGGIPLFHANRGAAAPDVAGQSQKLLHRYQLNTLVAGGLCGLLKIQLPVHGDAEYRDPVALAPGDQRLEHLFRGIAHGLRRMESAEILLVVFIEDLTAGDLCFFDQPNGICCVISIFASAVDYCVGCQGE